jgi:hypothetical protein
MINVFVISFQMSPEGTEWIGTPENDVPQFSPNQLGETA